jgi:hypothetical protein
VPKGFASLRVPRLQLARRDTARYVETMAWQGYRGESLVEMGQRHVREGEHRIARHRQLMARLSRSVHGDAWLAAAEFLTMLQAFQRGAEEHLAIAIRLERDRGGPELPEDSARNREWANYRQFPLHRFRL